MEGFSSLQLWLVIFLAAVIALVVFHKALGKLLGFLARTGVGLVFLALFSHIGGFFGVSLGVNLLNAAVLGLLGVPGFGLLLMWHWALL